MEASGLYNQSYRDKNMTIRLSKLSDGVFIANVELTGGDKSKKLNGKFITRNAIVDNIQLVIDDDSNPDYADWWRQTKLYSMEGEVYTESVAWGEDYYWYYWSDSNDWGLDPRQLEEEFTRVKIKFDDGDRDALAWYPIDEESLRKEANEVTYYVFDNDLGVKEYKEDNKSTILFGFSRPDDVVAGVGVLLTKSDEGKRKWNLVNALNPYHSHLEYSLYPDEIYRDGPTESVVYSGENNSSFYDPPFSNVRYDVYDWWYDWSESHSDEFTNYYPILGLDEEGELSVDTNVEGWYWDWYGRGGSYIYSDYYYILIADGGTEYWVVDDVLYYNLWWVGESEGEENRSADGEIVLISDTRWEFLDYDYSFSLYYTVDDNATETRFSWWNASSFYGNEGYGEEEYERFAETEINISGVFVQPLLAYRGDNLAQDLPWMFLTSFPEVSYWGIGSILNWLSFLSIASGSYIIGTGVFEGQFKSPGTLVSNDPDIWINCIREVEFSCEQNNEIYELESTIFVNPYIVQGGVDFDHATINDIHLYNGQDMYEEVWLEYYYDIKISDVVLTPAGRFVLQSREGYVTFNRPKGWATPGDISWETDLITEEATIQIVSMNAYPSLEQEYILTEVGGGDESDFTKGGGGNFRTQWDDAPLDVEKVATACIYLNNGEDEWTVHVLVREKRNEEGTATIETTIQKHLPDSPMFMNTITPIYGFTQRDNPFTAGNVT